MQKEKTNSEEQIAPMRKRREPMADGSRYIIYYTFGEEKSVERNMINKTETKESENV